MLCVWHWLNVDHGWLKPYAFDPIEVIDGTDGRENKFFIAQLFKRHIFENFHWQQPWIRLLLICSDI